MTDILVGAVGLIVGTLSLIWHVLNSAKQFLHIEVTVRIEQNQYISALTRVHNSALHKKHIQNALVLIGPEEESSLDTFNAVKKAENISCSSIAHCIATATYKGSEGYKGPEGRSIIPLSFYSRSECDSKGGKRHIFSNELLTYRVHVCAKEVPKGTPYCVRFFVAARGRSVRSTQDSFVLH